jgi:hypothetical protein
MSDEAFCILKESFRNPVNEGICWNVSSDGASIDIKKSMNTHLHIPEAHTKSIQDLYNRRCKKQTTSFDSDFSG